MPLIDTLTRWFRPRAAEYGTNLTAAQLLDGTTATSLRTLTAESAMRTSAVYACVSLIGGAVASLPLKVYRLGADNQREAVRPDLWWLLNEAPFPCWPAAVAWEFATTSLLLQGDAFWRIHRENALSNKIMGLEPLHPGTVSVTRKGDRLIYRITAQPAQVQDRPSDVVLDQDDVVHVPGPGFNGLRGMSQIQTVLATGGAIALQSAEYTRSFYENSARPDFALTTDGSLKPEQIENLRAQWDARHQGAGRAHRPVILTGGMKVEPLTMNAEDAQLIQTRQFQVEDIARAFGVPPFMIGHTEKTTSWGSGVEAMGIGFVKYTLQRHLVKFEQEINRKVFRGGRLFCEFDTAGLERGDLKSRYEAYRIAIGRAGEPGWLTPDEVRRFDNLPPMTGSSNGPAT